MPVSSFEDAEQELPAFQHLSMQQKLRISLLQIDQRLFRFGELTSRLHDFDCRAGWSIRSALQPIDELAGYLGIVVLHPRYDDPECISRGLGIGQNVAQ